MSELNDLVQMLKKDKQTGSDYTGTVTRVEGNTAFVRLTGADIADTPVARTIDCKAGDSVRIRVTNGKAWITGNDTSPPTYDVENINRINNSYNTMTKKVSVMDAQIADIGSVYSLPCTVSYNSSRISYVEYTLYVIPIFHLAMLNVFCRSKGNYTNLWEKILDDLPYSLELADGCEQSISVGSTQYYLVDSNTFVYPGVMEHRGSSVYISASDPWHSGDVEVRGSFSYLYSELNDSHPLSSGKKVVF